MKRQARLCCVAASLLILWHTAICQVKDPDVTIILRKESGRINLTKTLLCATSRINEDILQAHGWNVTITLLYVNDYENDLETHLFQAAGTIKTFKEVVGIIGPETVTGFHLLRVFLGGTAIPHIYPLSSDPWMYNEDRFPWVLRIADDDLLRVS